MELLDALAQLRSTALERIAEAARKGDAALIRALADTVGHIDADLKLAREIEARRDRYARDLTGTRPDQEPPAGAFPPRPAAAPVSRTAAAAPGSGAAAPAASGSGSEPDLDGPDPRLRFLEAAERAGSRLFRMTRTLYRTPAGKAVAVPFANEVRPGRWLLSVEDMRYDFVALLCQAAQGDLHAFVLPWRALEPAWKGLSRNGRQVKLTVAKRPDGFWLQVPGTDGLRIDAHLGACAALGAEAAGAP